MRNPVTFPTPSEDRISQREHIYQIAKVSYGKAFSVDCGIFDISLGGAKLIYHDPTIIPDIVAVRFPAGNVVSCRVRWRTADAFGVEFMKLPLPDW